MEGRWGHIAKREEALPTPTGGGENGDDNKRFECQRSEKGQLVSDFEKDFLSPLRGRKTSDDVKGIGYGTHVILGRGGKVKERGKERPKIWTA